MNDKTAVGEFGEKWVVRMAHRKNVSCYPYTIKVTMPYKCRGCQEAYTTLKRGMTGIFGGVTVYTGEGLWYDKEKNEIVPDDVKVIESAHSCLTKQQEIELETLVGRAARTAHQKSVAIKAGQYFFDAGIKSFWRK